MARPCLAVVLGWSALAGASGPNAPLTVDTINPAVVNAQYAVRGELILRAGRLKEELASDPASKPFDKLVECNIGNPQALRQQPLSFNREGASLLRRRRSHAL